MTMASQASRKRFLTFSLNLRGNPERWLEMHQLLLENVLSLDQISEETLLWAAVSLQVEAKTTMTTTVTVRATSIRTQDLGIIAQLSRVKMEMMPKVAEVETSTKTPRV